MSYYEYQSLVSCLRSRLERSHFLSRSANCYKKSHFSKLEYKCLTSIVRNIQKLMDYRSSYLLKDVISVIRRATPYKCTTLGCIVNTGNKELVQHYVKNVRLDIDVKSRFVVLDAQDSLETIGFSTPINIAVRNGFSDIFEILLGNNANEQELREVFYETHLSCETNINSLKIYRFFLKSDIATHSRNGEHVYAIERSLSLALRIGLLDIVKLLMNSYIGMYDPANEFINKLFLRVMKENNIYMLYFFIQVGIFNKWKYLDLKIKFPNFRNQILLHDFMFRNRYKIASYIYLSGFTGEFYGDLQRRDIKEMNSLKRYPLSLMNITRIFLRNYFIHFTDAHSIHIYLNKLKIPPILIAFLKMEDVDKPFA